MVKCIVRWRSGQTESSVDQKICKSNAIVHNLWKIWRPVPTRTGSYGRQAGRQLGRRNLG